MSKIYILCCFVLVASKLMSQNAVLIYQKNGTLLQIPISTIDSIIYVNQEFTTSPGMGVTQQGIFYPSIIYGNGQEWMTENLRGEYYANGEIIPHISDSSLWPTLNTGAWVYNSNDSTMNIPHGKLFNGYAVTDPRNVCPINWHVPNLSEWLELINYLGGDPLAGGVMKSTDNSYWITPNVGATNSSGFNALGSGSLYGDFTFDNEFDQTIWWTSTTNGDQIEIIALDAGFSSVGFGPNPKKSGFSIRCLKD